MIAREAPEPMRSVFGKRTLLVCTASWCLGFGTNSRR